MRYVFLLSACLIWAGMARAADRPEFAPIPAWVHPNPIPALTGQMSEAATQILLRDEQLRFSPGVEESYYESVVRIQTPQGLDSIGTISLSWNPETERLIVHKLHILRGDQVIDVLSGGQDFVVLRRENNLEGAALDGVLTAALQPEGLQVGDVIDLAVSRRLSDPAMGGQTDRILEDWADVPVQALRLRAIWDRRTPMRWQPSPLLTGLGEQHQGDQVELSLALDHVQPLVLPQDAPPRFRRGREIAFSSFTSWAEVAHQMQPLYARAAILRPGSPLLAEIARIGAASSDPVIRADMALALVQNKVRYVFLGTNDGGLVPASADRSWARRFGDCKGKTVLLLALLQGLGIEAVPVLVSTDKGDGLDQSLPMVAPFNHVLVRARIGGRDYWLDGTYEGGRHIQDIAVPFFHWGLPLLPAGAALIPMQPPPLAAPNDVTSVRIDARAGLSLPAPFHVEEELTGLLAISRRLELAEMTPEQRENKLRDQWRRAYDFVDIQSVQASYDEKTNTERLSMDGTAHMDWGHDRYETDGLVLGYKADFNRPPGPNRDAPFEVEYPLFWKQRETILLPNKGAGFTVRGDDLDLRLAARAYRRWSKIAGGAFSAEASLQMIAPEFSAREAQTAQRDLTAMSKNTIYIYKPDNYRLTDEEVAAEIAQPLTDTKALSARATMLMDRSDYNHAAADLKAILASQPRNAQALASLGLDYALGGQDALATANLDTAFAIDPKNALIFTARGLVALHQARYQAAITAFTTALTLQPESIYARQKRAFAYHYLHDDTNALADSAAVIAQSPDAVELYVLRANIFLKQGSPEKAVQEAAHLVTANPDNSDALASAGAIYARLHKTTEAALVFDRAIAIEPTETVYLTRAQYRPHADFVGRRADIMAALSLAPQSFDGLEMLLKLQMDQQAYGDAMATIDTMIRIEGRQTGLLTARATVLIKLAKLDQAAQEFAAARAMAAKAGEFNTLCWAQATAGVNLAAALRDCDRGLAQAPQAAAILDSRGFVLLRLQRYDEAIAAYQAALKVEPKLAGSLYGKAIAERRRGNVRASEADLAAAKAINQDVVQEFAGYGVTQ